MRVFITGATGFIGYAVAAELARAGHSVSGLARSAEKGTRVARAEVLPVIGEMSRPESYIAAAREAEVLIHCAAEYSQRYMELDRLTVSTLLEAAELTGRPRLFIYTSGCWIYGATGNIAVTEASAVNPPAMVAPRAETERNVLAKSAGKVRTLVLRPGCVYGGSGGLTALWFESAEKGGAARIVGDGSPHWTMVHVADLAVAYRLAAESAFGGEVFNVSDRSRFTVRECAAAASQTANGSGKVTELSVADAAKAMGSMAECLVFDQHIDASKAARWLGWTPRHGGFVDGVERYYAAWKASAK